MAGRHQVARGATGRGLPAPLVQLLVEHRAPQALDRERERQLWRESGCVVTSLMGSPLNPNSDYHRWEALLTAAEVRDARLHDARQTAATVLLVRVPKRTVMGIMRWSSTAMAGRYRHLTDPIRRTVADQVGLLLWADPEGSRGRNWD